MGNFHQKMRNFHDKMRHLTYLLKLFLHFWNPQFFTITSSYDSFRFLHFSDFRPFFGKKSFSSGKTTSNIVDVLETAYRRRGKLGLSFKKILTTIISTLNWTYQGKPMAIFHQVPAISAILKLSMVKILICFNF